MKTKGAATALHHIYADLEELGKKRAEIATRGTKAHTEALDAHYVRDRMNEIERLANDQERLRLAVIDQLRRVVEPLLERAAPPLEKRIASLEEQVRALVEQSYIDVPAERQRV